MKDGGAADSGSEAESEQKTESLTESADAAETDKSKPSV